MPVVEGGKASHTTLESLDIATSSRFFTEVMGLTAVRHRDRACRLVDTEGRCAAVLQVRSAHPQPLLNFYSRPVSSRGSVDQMHGRIKAAQVEYGIRDVTEPRDGDLLEFGVGTYGFFVQDPDGNWWRIEDNDASPWGPALLSSSSADESIVPRGPIAYVALECRRIDSTMRFYQEYLGMDAQRLTPRSFLSRGNGGVRVLIVEVGDRLVTQPLHNHHGITLPPGTDKSVIEAIHAVTVKRAAEFEIRQITKPTEIHDSYSFFLEDPDTNWWEVEVWQGAENTREHLGRAAQDLSGAQASLF